MEEDGDRNKPSTKLSGKGKKYKAGTEKYTSERKEGNRYRR